MKTYIVGRSPKADIIITDDNERTVSGNHLELTEDVEGRYSVVDRNSTNGTFRKEESALWVRIQKTDVSLDEPLLLGQYQTTVRKLLAMRTEQSPATLQQETGESLPQRG